MKYKAGVDGSSPSIPTNHLQPVRANRLYPFDIRQGSMVPAKGGQASPFPKGPLWGQAHFG